MLPKKIKDPRRLSANIRALSPLEVRVCCAGGRLFSGRAMRGDGCSGGLGLGGDDDFRRLAPRISVSATRSWAGDFVARWPCDEPRPLRHRQAEIYTKTLWRTIWCVGLLNAGTQAHAGLQPIRDQRTPNAQPDQQIRRGRKEIIQAERARRRSVGSATPIVHDFQGPRP